MLGSHKANPSYLVRSNPLCVDLTSNKTDAMICPDDQDLL